MKFIWEADDITSGRRFAKPGTSEEWMIGYITDHHSDENLYAAVSLADGMVGKRRTKEQLLDSLNAGEYVPREFLTLAEPRK